MTIYVFHGDAVDDYIMPDPRAFPIGTHAYEEGQWMRTHMLENLNAIVWANVDTCTVPKELRAKALLLT